ncbi:MAG: precorrin-3B C(17)-methyltransferase, partial [Pseudomonadota bacterium]
MPADPVFVALTPEGEGLGRRLAGALGAELHVRAPRGAVDAEVRQVAPHLRMLFAARRPILCIGAAGIVIRALAPLLSDKMS